MYLSNLKIKDSPALLIFQETAKSSFCERNGILLPKLFWPIVKKNCPSDIEKLLKFEAEGWKFSMLRSPERLIKQWKVRTIFDNRMLFNLFQEVSHIW